MKTAEEILKAICEPMFMEVGYYNTETVYSMEDTIEAMKEYAKQAIEEQLQEAAKEIDYHQKAGLDITGANLVRNCTRIELK